LKVSIEIGLARRVSISLSKQKVENLPVDFRIGSAIKSIQLVIENAKTILLF
jgi:hypothetical protein